MWLWTNWMFISADERGFTAVGRCCSTEGRQQTTRLVYWCVTAAVTRKWKSVAGNCMISYIVEKSNGLYLIFIAFTFIILYLLPRVCIARYWDRMLCVCLSVRLSVRLCVTIRYRDHIGWNSSKIPVISRPNSLGPWRGRTPNMGHLVRR